MEPTAPAAPRRAALAFIFVTVLIDILSFGLIIPVLPHLIENFLHGNVAAAARWYTGFASVFMAMQFVFTPVQGALSDRYGRRPVILLSNLGLGLDFAMMALVNSLPLLFIGRVVSGITSASFSTANAYIADITPPQQRAQAFGMIGMAFGLGFIIAPFIGGHLGAIDVRLPFWAAVAMSLTNFCYGWFVLPESLPVERRTTRFDWGHANPLGSLALLRRYPQVLGIAGVLFLMAFAHMVYPTTFVLYADYRFGWGPDMAGNTLALVGLLAAIVQGVLIKRIVAALGERRTLLFGLACGAVGFALYALAPTGYWFWAMMPVAALWGVATPAAQALMTHAVDPREQGRLQGAVASLSSIAGILGALVFPTILAAVAGSARHDVVAGATFWLAALIVGSGGVLAWRVSARLPAVTTAAPPPTIEPAVVSDADEIIVQPAPLRD
ncbi:TCR/Tet family MFS transporter [Dokdonella fugitiva]|jgi:DHA1 family tetracycline resistance protein-like MFS transporter|uniref:TCR/Tet family MFS transporter n=1 Tax=Dokdonella fugitiva TaxID=328517 RepID=UPI0015FA394F|nr:TCR/Tet family MFS transporter [Dokdonella fugitiva]MBA8882870.1 DHA1 family tetracycline resistance protein-like MFS transporter [Dokdonella fugitiva]